jgi:hypothetical protein
MEPYHVHQYKSRENVVNISLNCYFTFIFKRDCATGREVGGKTE